MRIGKSILWVVLLALAGAFTRDAFAQAEKEAQAGFRFLENPVAAEAVGRGGVGVTMLRNASALFWNPAGIGWIDGTDIGFHYTVGFADIDQMSAAVASDFGSLGVVGVSVTRMDYGTFYLTRRANNEQGFEETGEFTPQAMAVGLAYSRAMSDRFTFGVQAKLVHQDLGDAWIAPFLEGGGAADPTLKSYSMTVPAVDVGALYDFQAFGLTFGAAIQNVSYEVRYEEEQFPLPFNVRFSMTVDPIALMHSDSPYHNVTFGAETWKGRDFGTKMQFGAEYSFMEQFFVRAGYMGGYSERGMTLGAGFHKFDIRFDYAFQEMGVLGNIHVLSLAYALGR